MATNLRPCSIMHSDAVPLVSRAARERDCFNKDTGLVYRETVVSAPRQISIPQLTIQPRLPSATPSPGAPSLQDLAMRTFLAHIDAISPDMLLNVPWTVGCRLWKHVLEYDLARPSLWVAFAAAYPDEEQFQYFRASEIIPSRSFDEYIDYMASPSFQWLTCLTLSKISLDRADVMRISTLKNLLAMDIYTSAPDRSTASGANAALIDDRVVRDWSRLVQEAACFQRLRAVILRNQPGISARALEYLSAFPSLTLFGVKGCSLTYKHESTAEQHGWTTQDHHGLAPHIQTEIDKSHTWDGALTVCVKHSASILSSIDPSTPPDPPILSFRLGHTSNDVLYSAPILFFRRRPHSTRFTSPAPIPSTAFSDTACQPLPQDHCIMPTPNPQPVHPSAPPTPSPPATVPTTQSEAQPHKKRKLKVSVQRSFGNMLSGFGIDIVPSTSKTNPNSTGPNSENKSSKISSESATSSSSSQSSPPIHSTSSQQVPSKPQLPPEQLAQQNADDDEDLEQPENEPITPTTQQSQDHENRLPSKAPLTKRRQGREDRQRPWRMASDTAGTS